MSSSMRCALIELAYQHDRMQALLKENGIPAKSPIDAQRLLDDALPFIPFDDDDEAEE